MTGRVMFSVKEHGAINVQADQAILDPVSAKGGTDESISITGTGHFVMLQGCLIAETLNGYPWKPSDMSTVGLIEAT